MFLACQLSTSRQHPVRPRTCSDAAGPGAFDFTQGDTEGTPFWRLVRNLLSTPTAEQIACHAPKPILLNTGYINTPYAWQPHITELSIVRLGNFVSLYA